MPRQLRYLTIGQGVLLGGTRLRRRRLDGGTGGDFMGWSAAERQAGLLLIVNNARFLPLVLRSARPSHPSP